MFFFANCSQSQELDEQREAVSRVLHAKVDAVLAVVDVESFTVDIAVASDMSIERSYVIEINHTPPTAGTSLFDWKIKDDRDLITGASGKPFELRIRNSIDTTGREQIHRPLLEWIDRIRGVIHPRSHFSVRCDGCHQTVDRTWFTAVETRREGIEFDLCDKCYKNNTTDYSFIKSQTTEPQTEDSEQRCCVC
jgi:hypothetical protein